MKPEAFLRAENWYGSFYELCLELGPTENGEAAVSALRCLWDRPELRGPWKGRNQFGTDPVDPEVGPVGSNSTLWGTIRLPGGKEVGCSSWLVREEAGSCWLDLCIPLGMLEAVFPVSIPLDPETNPWIPELEKLLASIADGIFGTTPFALGLIGEEASGTVYAASLTAGDCEKGGVLVPRKLWDSLAPKRKPIELSPDLLFVPWKGSYIEYDV